MRHTVTTTTWAEAAHSIPELGAEHKCARLHGHSYKITVELSTKALDDKGMVVDFGVIKGWLGRFDHAHLNTFFAPATAENFAQFIWEGLSQAILKPINDGATASDRVYLTRVEVVEGGKGNNVVTLTPDGISVRT